MVEVLFVCTGNICRSPTAEGVFRSLVDAAGLGERVRADSAGLIDFHAGEPPDSRSAAAARARGYDLSALRARAVHRRDYDRFDLLLAMDRGHLRQMQRDAPAARRDRIRLFLDYAAGFAGQDVPDPYYGGRDGFDHVLTLCEAGARGLLAAIQQEYL